MRAFTFFTNAFAGTFSKSARITMFVTGTNSSVQKDTGLLTLISENVMSTAIALLKFYGVRTLHVFYAVVNLFFILWLMRGFQLMACESLLVAVHTQPLANGQGLVKVC
jgi:hypothetical protein